MDKAALKEQKDQRKQAVNAASTVLISSLIGTAVGGAAGAMLWKSHRFIGFLLGSILVGAPVGATVGAVVVAKKAAEE